MNLFDNSYSTICATMLSNFDYNFFSEKVQKNIYQKKKLGSFCDSQKCSLSLFTNCSFKTNKKNMLTHKREVNLLALSLYFDDDEHFGSNQTLIFVSISLSLSPTHTHIHKYTHTHTHTHFLSCSQTLSHTHTSYFLSFTPFYLFLLLRPRIEHKFLKMTLTLFLWRIK